MLVTATGLAFAFVRPQSSVEIVAIEPTMLNELMTRREHVDGSSSASAVDSAANAAEVTGAAAADAAGGEGNRWRRLMEDGDEGGGGDQEGVVVEFRVQTENQSDARGLVDDWLGDDEAFAVRGDSRVFWGYHLRG